MKPGFAIQTYKGHAFDPKTMLIDSIQIEDIAHALSNLCRYVGHCRRFYSVAEHSVLTFRIAKELWSDDLDAQWAALMHDATEAYVGDVPTPLKVLLPEYSAIEDTIAKQIGQVFDVVWTDEIGKKVKTVDIAALATEAPNLFDDTSHWSQIQGITTYEHLLNQVRRGEFRPLNPDQAKMLFLDAFNNLSEKRRKLNEQREVSAD